MLIDDDVDAVKGFQDLDEITYLTLVDEIPAACVAVFDAVQDFLELDLNDGVPVAALVSNGHTEEAEDGFGIGLGQPGCIKDEVFDLDVLFCVVQDGLVFDDAVLQLVEEDGARQHGSHRCGVEQDGFEDVRHPLFEGVFEVGEVASKLWSLLMEGEEEEGDAIAKE